MSRPAWFAALLIGLSLGVAASPVGAQQKVGLVASFTILAEDRSEFGGGGTLRPERSGVGSTSFRDRRSLRNAGGGGTATGSPPRAVTARR